MKIVKDIRKAKNLSQRKYSFLCAYLISDRISPYLSSMYINKNVKPNKITLHMIYSGIIGAILFSNPNIYLKLLGAIFIHLWFILDCSDGEVARYTTTFSKYGKELDYMAHLINHPLFGFSIFMSLVQLERYNIDYLVIMVFLSNFLDYVNRNLYTLDMIVQFKEENRKDIKNITMSTIKKKILLITNIFIIYPNFILFGVVIYFIDYFVNTNILIAYLSMNIIFTSIFGVRKLIKFTRKFYIS